MAGGATVEDLESGANSRDNMELCAGCERKLQQSFPGASVVCRQLTDSTMNDARRWLSNFDVSPQQRKEDKETLLVRAGRPVAVTGEPDLVVLAAAQHGGHGRRGTHWQSPRGGFWATLGHRVELPLARLSGLSLAVGVAVQAAVRACGVRTILKWPNDLLLEDGGKLGGILVEVISAGQGGQSPPSWVLIGIGVNLHREEEKDKGEQGWGEEAEQEARRYPTLSCFTPGRVVTPPEFAAILAPHYIEIIGRFLRNGFTATRDAWLAGSYELGTVVRARNPERPDEFLRGEFAGVDESGALMLRVQTREASEGRRGRVEEVREIRIVGGEVLA